MADTFVLSALNGKYAELQGALKQADARARAFKKDIAHVEATIRLFKADWDGAEIAPRRPKARSLWYGKGRAIQAVLSILRTAKEPMTSREITLRAMKAKGISATNTDTVTEVTSSINATLKRRIGNGIVAHDAYPRRWSIG